MSDPLQVTPDGLRGVGDHLEEVSNKVKQVLSSLNTRLEGEGSPWGNDATGDGFAKGPNGYLAQWDWVKSSIGAKTKLLDDYTDSMRNAANTLQGQDQSS
jgi:uncharacterized protein YukE